MVMATLHYLCKEQCAVIRTGIVALIENRLKRSSRRLTVVGDCFRVMTSSVYHTQRYRMPRPSMLWRVRNSAARIHPHQGSCTRCCRTVTAQSCKQPILCAKFVGVRGQSTFYNSPATSPFTQQNAGAAVQRCLWCRGASPVASITSYSDSGLQCCWARVQARSLQLFQLAGAGN